MDDMADVYAVVERCRRALLRYSFTNEEARRECWAAEEELNLLEEDMQKWSEAEREPEPFLLT